MTLWSDETLTYGELPLASRRAIACVARRNGINLVGSMTFEEWTELLTEALG